MAPVQQRQQLNHHLVQQASFLKPAPFDYELKWDLQPVPAAPILLKQSQVGTIIGVVAAVQTVHSELANVGLGGLVAAGVVTAGAMALWWAASNKAASASKPQATSPVKPSSNTYDDLASHLPSSPVLALTAPSSKALMPFEPAACPALPAAEPEELPPCVPTTQPAAEDPTAAAAAAAAAAALTEEETARVTELLSVPALNLRMPAFAGVSVNLLEPGVCGSNTLSMKDHGGIDSNPNPAIIEHGRKKMAAWLSRTETNTLGLPRLDVPAGSSVEVLFKQKWQSLLLHAVTPEDWAGGRAAAWADMQVLAAYGVPLAGAVDERVVSGAAAVVE